MRISDWSSDVCSSDLHAFLTRSDFAVILTDESCALRNEQDATGRTVIDILRHLRGDLPREVGADTGDQRRRNDAPALEDVGRAGSTNAFGTFVRFAGAALEKGTEIGRASLRDRVCQYV